MNNYLVTGTHLTLAPLDRTQLTASSLEVCHHTAGTWMYTVRVEGWGGGPVCKVLAI